MNKVGCYLTPHTNSNSKGFKDLNIRPKTIKLLEENIGEKFYSIGFSSDFLNVTQNAVIKTNIDKWDYTIFKTSAKQRKQLTE